MHRCSSGFGYSNPALGATRSKSNPNLLLNCIGPGSPGISFNQFDKLITRKTDGDDGYVISRCGSPGTSGTLKINYN